MPDRRQSIPRSSAVYGSSETQRRRVRTPGGAGAQWLRHPRPRLRGARRHLAQRLAVRPVRPDRAARGADPDRPALLDATVQRTRAELARGDGAARKSIPAHRGPENTGEPGLARHCRQQSLSPVESSQRFGGQGRSGRRAAARPPRIRASPAIRPATTLAGNWTSGDDFVAASNLPTPRILRPSPANRTRRYC